jgi:hypothetical protein
MDFLSVWFWIGIVLMDPFFPLRQNLRPHHLSTSDAKEASSNVVWLLEFMKNLSGFSFLKSFRTSSSSFPLEKRGIEEAWIPVISKPQLFSNFKTLNPKEPEVWFCETTGSFIGFCFIIFFQIFEIHGHISESVLRFFGNHVAQKPLGYLPGVYCLLLFLITVTHWFLHVGKLIPNQLIEV